MAKAGGLSPTELATAEVQEIACKVKKEVEKILHRKFKIFIAIVYRIQVVAGTNYFIKVQVSDNEYLHLKVFWGLPPENDYPILVSVEPGKTRDEPLTDF